MLKHLSKTGGLIVLAFAAWNPAAQATSASFDYTGSPVTWTLPTTGVYQILAYGAQGGTGSGEAGCCTGGNGGLGAEIGGYFTLTAGQVLSIAVGGQGGAGVATLAQGGGGGGGSFVTLSGSILVIAGGGGGGGAGQAANGGDGGPGVHASGSGNGGSIGNVVTSGAGGGGYNSAGGGINPDGPIGGGAFPSLTGGKSYNHGQGPGGFGGGGGAFMGGGGGGGYSGGDGGIFSWVTYRGVGGTGGGSYLNASATNAVLLDGVRSGNGGVEIDLISLSNPMPEPATVSLFGIGMAAAFAARKRRNV